MSRIKTGQHSHILQTFPLGGNQPKCEESLPLGEYPSSNIQTLLLSSTSSDCQNTNFLFSLFLSHFLLLSFFLSFLSLPFLFPSSFPFCSSLPLRTGITTHLYPFPLACMLTHGLPCVTHMACPTCRHFDIWHVMCHSTLIVSKNVKFRLSWNSTKFA